MNRIEKITEMLKEQPNDQFLLHALALEYMKIGKWEKAESTFLRNLAVDPMYVGSYYHLGKVYENMGDFKKAARYYTHGIDVGLKKGDSHSVGELRSALMLLED